MTGLAALAYPGSRALAGWGRHLAPFQPQGLWVGHFFVHRVEALARTAHEQHLDSFSALLLQALSLEETDNASRLAERICLPSSLIPQLVEPLLTQGFLRCEGTGWQVSTLGQQALRDGRFACFESRRQVFSFVECLDREGRRRAPPRYWNLPLLPASPWSPEETHTFPASELNECVRKPESWKKQVNFPANLVEIALPDSVNEYPAWQKVLIDKPETICLALVLSQINGGGPRMLGFPTRPGDWELTGNLPPLTLEDWPDFLGEAANLPPLDVLREVWRAWSRPRNLPGREVDACVLTLAGHRLLIKAPPKLVERLRQTRSDLLKGEAWVVLGLGPIRAVLMLELDESGGKK